MDFWTHKIYNTPEDIFTVDERLFLGDYEGWQAVLVFKDWEFRIYTYGYDGDEESWEYDGWRYLAYEFEGFTGSYEEWTLGYVVVESNDADEIIKIITETCNRDLDYFSTYAQEDLKSFIKRRVGKANKYTKVYAYYK